MPVTEDSIDTLSFLEASTGLVGLFGSSVPHATSILFSYFRIVDLLGSSAFSVVQADLKGNIAVSTWCSIMSSCINTVQKVKARYDAAPSSSGSLQSLVAKEKAEGKKTATEGLMWLLRGLSFTCKSLQASQANEKEELSASFTKGYEDSLKKHHNFVVKGIFSVRITTRSRKDSDHYPCKGCHEGLPIP